MQDSRTIEVLHAYLDECPLDWQARKELADLYEENGDNDRAVVQRWLAKCEKAPTYAVTVEGATVWYWWRCDGIRQVTKPSHIGIVWRRLHGYTESKNRGFDSRREAEDALIGLVDDGYEPTSENCEDFEWEQRERMLEE